MPLAPGRRGRLRLAQTGLLASSLLAAGCGLLAGGPAPRVPADPTRPLVALPGAATLTATVRLGFGAGDRRLLAVDTDYRADDVDHVVLKLYEDGLDPGDVVATYDVPADRLGDPVSFGRLKADTTYHVAGIAYEAPGTAAGDNITDMDGLEPAALTPTRDDATREIALEIPLRARGQRIVTTWAGHSNQVTLTDGLGTEAQFSFPRRGALRSDGEFFVIDMNHQAIRQISPAGQVTTFVGSGASGFSQAEQVAIAPDGRLYVADTSNHKVREFSPTGVQAAPIGTTQGLRDGDGADTNAASGPQFSFPAGVAADATTIYVADTQNHQIRAIDRTTRAVTRLAGSVDGGGNPLSGNQDGPALQARFSGPRGLALGPDGALYIADAGSHRIRRLKDGRVSTVAGSLQGYLDGARGVARFNQPAGVAVDARGVVWVADTGNHLIRRIARNGNVRTWAGGYAVNGATDGPAPSARFDNPVGIVAGPDGTLYVSDMLNGRIRRIQ